MSAQLDAIDKVSFYQQTLCDLILVQFNKEIKYDYPIPPVGDVVEIVYKTLKRWDVEPKLKKDIQEVIKEEVFHFEFAGEKEPSVIRLYLLEQNIFGREFFKGLGNFSRYRKEERANAISRTYHHNSLSTQKVVKGQKDTIALDYKKDTQEFVDILGNIIKNHNFVV